MVEGIFIFIAFVFISISVVFGVKWRKEKNNLIKEILKSRQNICMGIMSISIAIYFFFNVSGFDLRLVLALFMVTLGLFNLIQGIRMHQHYTKQLPQKQAS